MEKTRKQKYIESSKVILIFTLLVFAVLVVTMMIVGLSMYAIYRNDSLNIQSPETIGLLTTFFLSSSIIIGTLISVVIGRIVLKDANKIVNGMQDLSRGDYSVRVPAVKSGLTKELVDNFNMLATELDNTRLLRSDFINDFAHEFKTPIVSLLGFAKLLKTENLSKEQRLEYLNVIEEEAQRLSDLATNSLNFTKVEKQTILSEEVRFNLSEQIRNCVLLLEKKWTAKNLDIDVELEETDVCANEELLKHVWINLIDNAVKFSNANAELKISLEHNIDHAEFLVRNQGVEITDEEKDKIFNRFYRSKNANGIEGTGVGLAIVKKIVDLHGGKVAVSSSGGVTQFKVTLPINLED